MVWNAPSKSWTGGATMADASLNRRMTVRPGDAVTFAQIGVVGLDGQIELEALRLYGLPEAAPALLCGTPTLPVGQHEFAAEVALDLPSLAPAPCTWSTSRWQAPGRATAPRPRSPPRRASSSSTRCLVEQHGARAGAEHLGLRLRPRRGDAVGGGHQAADPVDTAMASKGLFRGPAWRHAPVLRGPGRAMPLDRGRSAPRPKRAFTASSAAISRADFAGSRAGNRLRGSADSGPVSAIAQLLAE